MIKYFFQEALVIIILATVMALVVNALRPDGISLFGDNEPHVVTGQGFIEEIDINQAMLKFKTQTALFIDARSSGDYAKAHIKGAINLPDQQFDQWIDDFLLQFDPLTEMVTYCSGMDCSQAKDLAEKLCQSGFEKTVYFPGGYDQWQKHKLPIEKNDTPKPLS